MKVLLVDVDKTGFPNLALCQISAWHKTHGDEVGFDTRDPDKIYISCVFSENREQAHGIPLLYPPGVAELSIGGSGVGWDWLPEGMQKIKPDYDLYPGMTTSMGFTTRGCIRTCPWCVVPRKEGSLQRWQRIKEFHDPRFRKVRLLDNNILADPEWFFLNTDFLLENDLKVDINQAMDIRLLTPEICARLKELKWAAPKRFAFDSVEYADAVIRGVNLLRGAGIRIWRDTIQCYVLVGAGTSPEEDVQRLRLLKGLNVQPYVMPFRKTLWTQKLKWWARPQIFWSCDIENMDRQRFRSD